MLGAEGVSAGLAGHLTTLMPDRLATIRARLDVGAKSLPDLKRVYPEEVPFLGIESFPAAVVVMIGTDGRLTNRQADRGASYEEHLYRYNVRIHLYAVDSSTMLASRQIKRLTLAVREALLSSKSVPVPEPDFATIDPQQLRESYGEIELRDRQFIAGSYVEIQVATQEILELALSFDGPAEISVDATATPPTWRHPEAD